MLSFTRKQIDELRQARLRGFIEATERELALNFPREIERITERQHVPLAHLVEKWVTQARHCRMSTEAQMRIYIDACIILGEAQLVSPADRRLAETLEDPALGGDRKAEFLEHYLAFMPR